ncbi:MAG: hypothetical protein M0Z28_30285 [Rhodospirillales bacterium]|nr:hypothetical protein [Rhodospirillales bacterium]
MSGQATPPMPVRCAACAFWGHFNDSVGVCRRRAPQPASGSDRETVAHWPETFAEEGCGDGRPSGATPGPLACQECAYWMQGAADGGLEPVDFNDQPRAWWRRAGRCVRHSPLPLTSPGARLVWPATHASDGCGEGAPRGPAPPEQLHQSD